MENTERLVAKAYEWIDQASHELRWDESYTKDRKGEGAVSVRVGHAEAVELLSLC